MGFVCECRDGLMDTAISIISQFSQYTALFVCVAKFLMIALFVSTQRNQRIMADHFL
jgi:hypothetical protein